MVASIGIVVVLGLVTAALAVLRLPAWRWTMIGLVCLIVALIVAPAKDVFTVTIVGILLAAFVSNDDARSRLRE
jgi:ABC-type enterochelin transport system permease subunit